MPSYRLYRIDGAGNIMSADWLEAGDDEEVVRLAREQVPEGMAEVWERSRLVARVRPGDGPTEA